MNLEHIKVVVNNKLFCCDVLEAVNDEIKIKSLDKKFVDTHFLDDLLKVQGGQWVFTIRAIVLIKEIIGNDYKVYKNVIRSYNWFEKLEERSHEYIKKEN